MPTYCISVALSTTLIHTKNAYSVNLTAVNGTVGVKNGEKLSVYGHLKEFLQSMV